MTFAGVRDAARVLKSLCVLKDSHHFHVPVKRRCIVSKEATRIGFVVGKGFHIQGLVVSGL